MAIPFSRHRWTTLLVLSFLLTIVVGTTKESVVDIIIRVSGSLSFPLNWFSHSHVQIRPNCIELTIFLSFGFSTGFMCISPWYMRDLYMPQLQFLCCGRLGWDC